MSIAAADSNRANLIFGCLLFAATCGLIAVGIAVGSLGWEPLLGKADTSSAILWQIRLPRTIGAWMAGALLGVAGAIAQGLFRNPLADPYLLGSASGANLGVSLFMVALGMTPAATGWPARFGLTGAAFIGALLGVAFTLFLAKGVQQTLRLLLAGVVVGMVLSAFSSLVIFWVPDIMRAMQAFLLGTTAFLGWTSVTIMGALLLLSVIASIGFARALDALSLGETTAASLGIPLAKVRLVLIAALALATGAAVAQVGLVPFIGLVAPHLVRAAVKPTHGWLLFLSALMGGVVLLAADVIARWAIAPQELPVGVITALIGGVYLLRLMHRRSS